MDEELDTESNLVVGYVEKAEENYLIVVPGQIIICYSLEPWRVSIKYDPDSLEASIGEFYFNSEDIIEGLKLGKLTSFLINPCLIQEFLEKFDKAKSNDKKTLPRRASYLLNCISESADVPT